MIEHHSYRGHAFRLQFLETQAGRYRWMWRMDDGLVWKGTDALQTLEVARSEAMVYAQIAIGRRERATASL